MATVVSLLSLLATVLCARLVAGKSMEKKFQKTFGRMEGSQNVFLVFIELPKLPEPGCVILCRLNHNNYVLGCERLRLVYMMYNLKKLRIIFYKIRNIKFV